MLVKLKAVYTLVEQLYAGAQHTIVAISHTKQAPSLLRDVLNKIYVLPVRIEEMKRSSARVGAIIAFEPGKGVVGRTRPG